MLFCLETWVSLLCYSPPSALNKLAEEPDTAIYEAAWLHFKIGAFKSTFICHNHSNLTRKEKKNYSRAWCLSAPFTKTGDSFPVVFLNLSKKIISCVSHKTHYFHSVLSVSKKSWESPSWFMRGPSCHPEGLWQSVEVGWQESHENQQEVQSPAPREEQPQAPGQAGGRPAGKLLCRKGPGGPVGH